MVLRTGNGKRYRLSEKGGYTMNCLCNLFNDDNIIWIIIIILLLWCCGCNG